MSNLQTRKQNVLNTNLQGVNEYFFNKAIDNGNRENYLGFSSYQDFVNTQRETINQFDESSLNTMELLNQIIQTASFSDPGGDTMYNIRTVVFDRDRNMIFVGSE